MGVDGDDPLTRAVAAHVARDEREADDLRRVRALIESGDPWSRREPLHITASALIVDPAGPRVLLRWHTRMQRWMQVGGHADPGERDPWAVACREAREETGLSDLGALTPAVERRPVQIVIVPVPSHGDDPAHEHADIRYALRTAEPERAAAESPAARVQWIDLADAQAQVDEDNLREYLRRVSHLTSTPPGQRMP